MTNEFDTAENREIAQDLVAENMAFEDDAIAAEAEEYLMENLWEEFGDWSKVDAANCVQLAEDNARDMHEAMLDDRAHAEMDRRAGL